ncbi:MAG: prepilin-type N-terminal cleavage/methylation domain-containing protein [Planctomycetes bacterium]|nr:prepilin-type N-terminal cleavage/methylation domain-containing protein [Planctomycetota bacterium]
MRAFTLVELLVALALGLIIAFTAYAGLRVAAKTMTVAQNLSRENRVLADGYARAMGESDFWWAEDDPFDPAGQQQRRPFDDAGNPGIASSTAYNVVNGVPGQETVFGQPFAPLDLSDEYWNYKVSDPRTWSRQGYYKSPHFLGWTTGSYAQVGCIGHPDGESAWMHVEQDRMYANLGWNGYVDYLPNPWIVGYYLGRASAAAPTTDSAGRSIMGTADWWEMSAFPRGLFLISMNAHEIWLNSSQAPEKALGRSGVHLYDITTAFAPRPGWTAEGAGSVYVRVSQRSVVKRLGEMTALQPSLYASLPHVALTRRGWPESQVKVLRTSDALETGRVEAIVGFTNPTTGASRQFSFAPIPTSLRGARQQRQWAHWNAADMDR